MAKKVLIENPAAGGVSFCALNRAKRFVNSGRAAWVAPGNIIRFVEQHHAHQSVLKLAAAPGAYGYDRISRALKEHELRAIPLAGNVASML